MHLQVQHLVNLQQQANQTLTIGSFESHQLCYRQNQLLMTYGTFYIQRKRKVQATLTWSWNILSEYVWKGRRQCSTFTQTLNHTPTKNGVEALTRLLFHSEEGDTVLENSAPLCGSLLRIIKFCQEIFLGNGMNLLSLTRTWPMKSIFIFNQLAQRSWVKNSWILSIMILH